MVVRLQKIDDLINYFTICFEHHQCNAMHVFQKVLNVRQLERYTSFYEKTFVRHFFHNITHEL